MKAKKNECKVRCYRHGLGDCFLLAFYENRQKQRYMLIDCGLLLGTNDQNEKMKDVAEDIMDSTNGTVDVLAVTHEHWDHISGFHQAASEFDSMNVGQLWLSWTEDPNDLLAKELRKRYEKSFALIKHAMNKVANEKSVYLNRIMAMGDFYGGFLAAGGRKSTSEIFKDIKNKWGDNTVYCRPGMKPLRFVGRDDISAFILGPPVDKKALRKSKPSKKHKETYLHSSELELFERLFANDGSGAPGDSLNLPFSDRYCERRDDYGFSHNKELQRIKEMYDANNDEWRKIDNDWVHIAGELALKMDAHTNNTSLVMAIELGNNGKVLLFPGDAQVGNWLSWKNVKWNLDDGEITADDLLARTVLYKVGHHGSHNATLQKEGLEKMTHPQLTAVIPVSTQRAEEKKWHMPFSPLYEQLKEKTDGRTILTDAGVEPVQQFMGDIDVDETDLYTDLTIKF